MVAHVCIPNTWEWEAKGSGVQGHLWLHTTQDSVSKKKKHKIGAGKMAQWAGLFALST